MSDQSTSESPYLAEALLLATITIWGVNFSVIKVALAELHPLPFNTVRFLAAAFVVVTATWVSGRRWRFAWRHVPWLLGLGLLGNSVYQLLFIFGANLTTADNAALMLATMPAWVAVMGSLARTEEVRTLGWVGVVMSLVGIAFIILGSDREASFRFGGATLRGDLLVLVATGCWAAYTALMRPALRLYDSISVTSFCVAMGSIPNILLGLPALLSPAGAEVSILAYGAGIFSGAFAIGLSYFFWNYGIGRLGSARTSLYSNLTPIVALATAWLWLGETLTWQQGVGSVLALLGVVLARKHTRPRI